MILMGVTATDSHQQESERVKIELEVLAGVVKGQIGVCFGSVYEDASQLPFSMQNIKGEVASVEADGSQTLHLRTHDDKYFFCDAFTSKEFFLWVSDKEALLFEKVDSPKTLMWHL